MLTKYTDVITIGRTCCSPNESIKFYKLVDNKIEELNVEHYSGLSNNTKIYKIPENSLAVLFSELRQDITFIENYNSNCHLNILTKEQANDLDKSLENIVFNNELVALIKTEYKK